MSMEIATSFTQFLQTGAILSQSQADDLTTAMTKKDENQKIFLLADFFRCLNASDCYDLSLRLYMLWKRSESPSSEGQAGETPRKGLQKTPKNDTSMTTVYSSRKNRMLSPDVSDIEVKPLARSNTQNSGIFDSHSKTPKNKTPKNTENQKKDEMEECTFQPKITAKAQMTKSAVDVFGRLQRDTRSEKREIYEAKKAQKETVGCTFQPDIIKSTLDGNQPSEALLSRTFDRLYRENLRRKNNSIGYEKIRKELEVKDCTFHPEIITKDEETSFDEVPRSEKLYKLHAQRERNLMKKQIEKSVDEVNRYSFKPTTLGSPTSKDDIKHVYDRLIEWQDKKNRKAEMKYKEKVQKELEMSRDVSQTTSRRKDDNDVSRDQSSIHDRLYQDSKEQKGRKEKIVKDVLKDMGASFKPKTNSSRGSSVKELKRMTTSFQLINVKDRDASIDDEVRHVSPAPEKLSGRRNPFADSKGHPHSLNEVQTATFGK